MTPLADLLIEAGMIQFGWFGDSGAIQPVALHLDLLPAFPDILDRITGEAAAMLAGQGADRLLCTADSIPFGVAYSLKSRIPLVYSRGTDAPPVDDLVGAYDIGHPALLLTNAVGQGESPAALIAGARRVGLEIHTLLAILEVRPLVLDGVEVLSLLRLADLVRDLSAAGRLPRGHAQAVRGWLE